jgi:hypothetical protein
MTETTYVSKIFHPTEFGEKCRRKLPRLQGIVSVNELRGYYNSNRKMHTILLKQCYKTPTRTCFGLTGPLARRTQLHKSVAYTIVCVKQLFYTTMSAP